MFGEGVTLNIHDPKTCVMGEAWGFTDVYTRYQEYDNISKYCMGCARLSSFFPNLRIIHQRPSAFNGHGWNYEKLKEFYFKRFEEHWNEYHHNK